MGSRAAVTAEQQRPDVKPVQTVTGGASDQGLPAGPDCWECGDRGTCEFCPIEGAGCRECEGTGVCPNCGPL